MNKRMAGIVSMALLAAVALTGCGSSGGGSSSSGGAKETVVKMKSTQFSPKTVEIKAGETVKWVNDDPVDHSVFEGKPDNPNPAFKSGDLSNGKSFTHTFDKAGTYDIFCNTGGHGLIGMTMKVVVK